MKLEEGDLFRLRSNGAELFLCTPLDAMAAGRGRGIGPLPRDLAPSLLGAALAEITLDLRCFVARADAGGEPLWRISDARLRTRLLQQVADGALVVVAGDAGGSRGAFDGDGASESEREQRDLELEFRALTRGVLAIDGRQYELLSGTSIRAGRALGGLEILPRDEALKVLARAAAASRMDIDLKRVVEKAAPLLAADEALPAAADGLLVAVRPRAIVTPQDAPTGPMPAAATRRSATQHWVAFRFKDSAGRPLSRVEYRLELPDGNVPKGSLDSQGKVRQHDQPSGDASIDLLDIDDASWSEDEVDAHEPVELSADIGSDCAAGQSVRFEICRLFRERDADIVATLEGKLDADGHASVNWTPSSIDLPDDQFVFKASIRRAWRKSAPLTVSHRVAAADWSAPQAQEGDALTLRATLRGVPDGESAAFKIFEKRWRGGRSDLLDTVAAAVSGGVAEAGWSVPAAAAPPPRGDPGRRDFHYVVEAAGLQCKSTHVATLPASAVDETEDAAETEDQI